LAPQQYGAMDTAWSSPAINGFEAVGFTISALVYVTVAVAALIRAPRDQRVHVFLLVAISNLGPYLFPAWFWMRGETTNFTTQSVFVVVVSMTLGSVALFHFMQVFPWRRPWIRGHGRWLVAAYLVCPVVGGALVLKTSTMLDDMTPGMGIVLLVLGVPLLVLVSLVLPFAGLLSLYASWRTATLNHVDHVAAPTLAILISQLAGGVLAILIIPLMHVVVTTGSWTKVASGLLLGFGLMMPLAFAAAVWWYHVLEIDPASPRGSN
jgi:hypothetical protein